MGRALQTVMNTIERFVFWMICVLLIRLLLFLIFED